MCSLRQAQLRAVYLRNSLSVRLPSFIFKTAGFLQALDLYASTKLDFGDALIIASMQQQGSQVLYSYDTDFDRIEGITRREP